MKLSQQQISALAEKITSELNTPREDAHNKNFTQSVLKALKDKRAKDLFRIAKVEPDLTKTDLRVILRCYHVRSIFENNILRDYYDYPKVDKVSYEAVKTEIVLATIESHDLDSLISKIKTKFTK